VRSYDAALKVEGGRLHGCMIHPRTAGIFTKA
jgi:hypothetical protein